MTTTYGTVRLVVSVGKSLIRRVKTHRLVVNGEVYGYAVCKPHIPGMRTIGMRALGALGIYDRQVIQLAQSEQGWDDERNQLMACTLCTGVCRLPGRVKCICDDDAEVSSVSVPILQCDKDAFAAEAAKVGMSPTELVRRCLVAMVKGA